MFFVILVLFVAIHGNYGSVTGDVPCCAKSSPRYFEQHGGGPEVFVRAQRERGTKKVIHRSAPVLSFQMGGELLAAKRMWTDPCADMVVSGKNVSL
jgi:hypothetical protein